MTRLLSAPWFLAVMALLIMLGTQFAAFKLYWHELFPSADKVVVIKREEPAPLHWGFSSDEILRLKEELETRLLDLEAKERELEEYEARLKVDRAEIDDIKINVQTMRDGLLGDIIRLEETEKKNLKTLAKTYGFLEPAATVSIFKELDDPTVVKILYYMKQETVGGILQEMAVQNGGDPEQIQRAARLSDLLRLFSEENV